jgi:hypothetical protein
MRLWIKLAALICIAVAVQHALNPVLGYLGDLQIGWRYTYAVHFGTPEDERAVLDLVASRMPIEPNFRTWMENRRPTAAVCEQPSTQPEAPDLDPRPSEPDSAPSADSPTLADARDPQP